MKIFLTQRKKIIKVILILSSIGVMFTTFYIFKHLSNKNAFNSGLIIFFSPHVIFAISFLLLTYLKLFDVKKRKFFVVRIVFFILITVVVLLSIFYGLSLIFLGSNR